MSPGPTPDDRAADADRALVERARGWADADPDPTTAAQVRAAIDASDLASLSEWFDHDLEFGTAGLRAAMGPGPARMNRVVVRRAAAALAGVLLEDRTGRPRVVVAHDARHRSATFARDVSDVLTDLGVDAERFDEAVPTPLLALAVTHRRADAGVMITASHNPGGDNGVKVYAADGAQIVAPFDRRVAERMRAMPPGPPPHRVEPTSPVGHLGGPRLGGPVVDAYLQRVDALLDGVPPTGLRVARTSLHGVGGPLCALALRRVPGLVTTVVDSQEEPDPDFPTVAVPNPEEPGTLDALLDTASATRADAAFALDPDADRLALALPGSDGATWRVLTGDELGALLAAHLIDTTEGPDRLIATTVVSSRLVPLMCEDAGIHHVETLTGFKWLCRPAMAHPGWQQLLLYEEALGYAVGPGSRDKDGTTAAVVALVALARWRAQGRSGWDVLDGLARRHGAHVTRNGWLRHDPGQGLDRWLDELADRPPGDVGGTPLVRGDRPAPDVVRWYLADGTRIVLRPSGTEPKLKYYLEAVRPVDGSVQQARRDASASLEGTLAALLVLLTDRPIG